MNGIVNPVETEFRHFAAWTRRRDGDRRQVMQRERGLGNRMRLGLVLAIVALGVSGCTRTYESNLAFDVTQRAYATDRTAQAVVVTYIDGTPQNCSGLVVC